jgi:hypothetical protein
MRTVVAFLLLLFASKANAQPQLELPVACKPAKDCWISNYVDLDEGPGIRDYACGRFTYDGHKGVDIALRDRKAMDEGVAVLAAAAGKVLRTRDGEPDISARDRPGGVKGRDCGNAVVIDHGGGVEGQYCHLRRGSVAVRRGATVAAGEKIGLVGLSGSTEYPHLHLTLRYRGQVVDPFLGPGGHPGCGPGSAPLWSPAAMAALPYATGALYNFGVAAAMVSPDAVRRGEHRGRTLAADAPLFAVWMEAYGVRADDRLTMTVDGPEGRRLINYQVVLPRDQARIFRIVARKRGAEPWRAGAYAIRIALAPKEDAARAAVVEFAAEVR